jgi:hypothetical protein
MAFSTTETQESYAGNGTVDTFAIPFNFTQANEIAVELWDITDPAEPAQVTPFTDWSVVGLNVVTTAPVPVDHVLIVYRSTNDAHDTLYSTYEFPFNTANVDLDQVYQRLQELRDRINAAITDNRLNIENGEIPLTMDDVRDLLQAVSDIETDLANGGAVPNGGLTGAALVKNSDDDGDAVWEDFRLNGFSTQLNRLVATTGLLDAINQLFEFSYLAPLVSLAASGSGTVREKGDTVTATNLTANVTRRSDPIARIQFFFNGVAIPGADFDPPANTGSGSQAYSWTGAFADNATFRVDVTDDGTTGGPSTVSASSAFTFVYPYYYGAGAVGLTASAVAALTKDIRVSTASLNRVFTATAGQVFYFAYPASYGALTSILDENGFETFNDWTLRTENITGLDGNPVSYRIYEFENPSAGGTTNYTFIR